MEVRLFVSCLARAFAKDALGTVLTPFGLRWLPDGLADYYEKRKEPRTRLLELEAVVVTPASEMGRIAQECLAGTEGAAVPEAKAQEFVAYMSQVPGVLGRSLRRAEDPQGRTVPLDLVCARPQELARLLPQGMPRFRPDQAPLRGLDLRLVELLGVGGFGEVWKACNLRQPHAPPVALKFCLDPLAAASLQREADLLDRVMHEARLPGIVRLRQTYLDAEPPFLEYEYIDGGDLNTLIAEWHRGSRAGPSPNQAARVILRLARAMAPVHALNPPIVHRDLKPANILLTREGGESHFWIADFGIGDVAAAAEIAATASGKSRPGVEAPVSGYSALYASPQQRRGEQAVPQDDVYALGVIWYQLLVGDLAQGAPSGQGWRRRLHSRGATDAMIEVLGSCFEDDAEDRPRDAGVLVTDLEGVLCAGSAGTQQAPKPGPSEPRGAGQPATRGIELPGLILVRGAEYPDVKGLAAGSGEAQERQRRFVQETGLPLEVENTIGMRFRLIPPGHFLMGSPKVEQDLAVNKGGAKREWVAPERQHWVELTGGFYLGTTEVTQGQWRQVMGSNPSYFQHAPDDAPVEEVSWEECEEFCRKMWEREGVEPGTYRLPTEAEWEYACRAGTSTAVYNGDLEYRGENNAPILDAIAWYGGNSGVEYEGGHDSSEWPGKQYSHKRAGTHLVRTKQANALGLHDMIGNVWEWCGDWFAEYPTGNARDPSGPSSGSARVNRGGGWYAYARNCRSAYRGWIAPGHRDNDLGLRLARQLPRASAR